MEDIVRDFDDTFPELSAETLRGEMKRGKLTINHHDKICGHSYITCVWSQPSEIIYSTGNTLLKLMTLTLTMLNRLRVLNQTTFDLLRTVTHQVKDLYNKATHANLVKT